MKFAHVLVALVVFGMLSSHVAVAQNLITGDVTRTFTSIKPTIPKTITENVLSPAGTSVYELRIDVLRTLVQARIGLDKVDPSKAKFDSLPGGSAFDYFNISGKNIESSDIDSLRIKFRVDKSWLSENRVDSSDVTLLMLSGSSWKDVGAGLLSDSGPSYDYQSEIGGDVLSEGGDLSGTVFVVIGESSAAPVSEGESGIQPEAETIPDEVNASDEEIVEVGSEEDVAQRRSEQDSMIYIIVGVAVVVALAAVFMMPGSILRKRSRKISA